MVGHRVKDLARVFAAAIFACAPTTSPAAAAGDEAPAICDRIVAIAVSKRERRLRAECEGGALVEMVVALGRGAGGPKLGVGDSRTPEGRYRIIGPPRHSRFHQFIPIDYPSLSDAETAYSEGRLSDADYHRIAAAHAQGQPPPADTALGGYLGLHGEGRRWHGDSRLVDWTLGCIGLADADVDFIAARLDVGTPVSIVP